jgi:hypothetical protein
VEQIERGEGILKEEDMSGERGRKRRVVWVEGRRKGREGVKRGKKEEGGDEREEEGKWGVQEIGRGEGG